MTGRRRTGFAAGMALALAACAANPDPQTALPAASGDSLADAAALLAGASAARGASDRAPYLARLDAMRVAAAEGETIDPLARWQAEAEAAGFERPVYRGRALGPAYRVAQIGPGRTIRIEQIFYAGQRAEIAAHTQGGEPVSLEIRNPRTEEVCTAELRPRASCRWLPLFTERFSIELLNRSRNHANVYIVFR